MRRLFDEEDKMLRKWLAVGFLVSVGALSVACAAEIGEDCETEGSTDDCVDGAVCGKRSDTDGTPVCLKVCTTDTDCSSGENCNGVTGSSIKACRIK